MNKNEELADKNVEISAEELKMRFRKIIDSLLAGNFKFDQSGVDQILNTFGMFGEINNLSEFENKINEIYRAMKIVDKMDKADEAQKKVYKYARQKDEAVK